MKLNYIIFLFSIILIGTFTSCDSYVEDGIDLPALPDDPTFTLEEDPNNPNRIIVKFSEEGFFSHVWDLPGGTPTTSTLNVDTIFYVKAGMYDITLNAAATDGGGTASSTQSIIIAEDAVIECDDNLTLLTDECTSKCWRLAQTPGAISVGPTPLSSEWFSSSDLDGAQVDDLWCFDFDGAAFRYMNNGNTFSSCANFSVIENYPIPANMTYSVVPSDSEFSSLKILLPEEFWMGVEDSGNEYEIIELSEDQMVLLTTIAPCDGTPSPGWFTLTFLAN